MSTVVLERRAQTGLGWLGRRRADIDPAAAPRKSRGRRLALAGDPDTGLMEASHPVIQGRSVFGMFNYLAGGLLIMAFGVDLAGVAEQVGRHYIGLERLGVLFGLLEFGLAFLVAGYAMQRSSR